MTLEPHHAVVRTPMAPLFAEPRVASAQISQLLAGRFVDLLEQRDDWYRATGPDSYEGWIHRGYLHVLSNGASGATAPQRISLGCVTTDSAGKRRAMPLGAYLTADEQVKSGDVIDVAQQRAAFPTEAGPITQTAQRYFEGTSYLWGGVTPWGADCSGLVQSVYALHGIQLRRDAWMQAEEGALGEADILAARAGDLLFFSDRIDAHITHVAISMGERMLVHLALGRGGYAVERLDDVDDGYVRKLNDRFVTARRVL